MNKYDEAIALLRAQALTESASAARHYKERDYARLCERSAENFHDAADALERLQNDD